MKFEDLKAGIVKIAIPFRNGTIDVNFRPDNIGRGDLERFQDATTESTDSERLDRVAEFLALGIESWGIEDIEPDKDAFMRHDFPAALILALSEQLGELVTVGKLKTAKR